MSAVKVTCCDRRDLISANTVVEEAAGRVSATSRMPELAHSRVTALQRLHATASAPEGARRTGEAGVKRSTVVDANGFALAAVVALANQPRLAASGGDHLVTLE